MLSGYPVVVDVVVRWSDMDALNHVSNNVYLQYFQAARIAYIQRMGMPLPRLGLEESGLIVAAISCRYRTPVTFPDTLSVGTRVAAMADDRFLMECAAFSQKLGKVAADGDTLMVAYDYGAGRRVPLSDEYRTAIIRVEGHEPSPLPAGSRRLRSWE
jgi:acyl-CoA thioester hydrolase